MVVKVRCSDKSVQTWSISFDAIYQLLCINCTYQPHWYCINQIDTVPTKLKMYQPHWPCTWYSVPTKSSFKSSSGVHLWSVDSTIWSLQLLSFGIIFTQLVFFDLLLAFNVHFCTNSDICSMLMQLSNWKSADLAKVPSILSALNCVCGQSMHLWSSNVLLVHLVAWHCWSLVFDMFFVWFWKLCDDFCSNLSTNHQTGSQPQPCYVRPWWTAFVVSYSPTMTLFNQQPNAFRLPFHQCARFPVWTWIVFPVEGQLCCVWIIRYGAQLMLP